jgi:peptidoglycan/xylan/chitin deacetylase (PgdA/CDA1 family)
MRIALKVDVDTLRGSRIGVPRLRDLFLEVGVGATFLFSVGPDHTGRAIRRVFRPGFVGKVRRTSIVGNYGIRTLLYGVLLPGPHIGRRAGEEMRRVRAAGFEVGLHAYDHCRWQDGVVRADAAWTRREFERALRAYDSVFGAPPSTVGAAGWQMNETAFALEEEYGLAYASDTRGRHPFYPRLTSRVSRCLQIPTTLPTLDELIGREGSDAEAAVDGLFDRTREESRDQVWTLHAELEGIRYRPLLRRLLLRWREAGVDLVGLGAFYRGLNRMRCPACGIRYGSIPGRSGFLALQDDSPEGARADGSVESPDFSAMTLGVK